MAGETVFLFAVIGHGDYVRAFLHIEKFRVTGAALHIFGVDFMIIPDGLLALSERFRCLVDRHVLLRSHSLNPDMAPRALRIRGKSLFAVVTGSAIFFLV